MNETIEEKKKILNRYKAAIEKYNSLKKQEKFLRTRISSPRTSVLSGMPSSKKHSDISDIMVKLDDTLKMVKAAEDDVLNTCADVERIILNIHDGVASDIIHMRYIELLPWEEIADQLGYSRSQVSRIHNKALESLEIA